MKCLDILGANTELKMSRSRVCVLFRWRMSGLDQSNKLSMVTQSDEPTEFSGAHLSGKLGLSWFLRHASGQAIDFSLRDNNSMKADYARSSGHLESIVTYHFYQCCKANARAPTRTKKSFPVIATAGDRAGLCSKLFNEIYAV